MKLYTSEVVADWLGVTGQRVRQLRAGGIIEEKQPGLYDLKPTVTRYIQYLRKGSGATNLNDERAMLTRARREAAELENQLTLGKLHRTEDIEAGLRTVFLNLRSRFLALPAKVSAQAAAMNGDQAGIFDLLTREVSETLNAVSVFSAMEEITEGEQPEEKEPEPGKEAKSKGRKRQG